MRIWETRFSVWLKADRKAFTFERNKRKFGIEIEASWQSGELTWFHLTQEA